MFIVNESSTAGMLLALQDAGLAGKVKFVGFDANQAFVDAMRKGELAGLRAPEPVPHGGARGRRRSSTTCRARPVPEARSTPASRVVTPANLDAPEMQALLKPPLDQYLKPGE